METIYINEENCRIHKAGEHIIVKKDGQKIASAPLITTKTIIINTSVQLTTQVMEMFLDKEIDIIFMNSSGKIKGQLLSQKRNGVVIRMAQYDCFFDKERRVDMARSMIRGKIVNQCEIVKKYRLPNKGDTFIDVVKGFNAVLKKIDKVSTVEEIMGYEGVSARIYFDAVRRMLKRKDFVRREYRPAHDIINATLNLGYAFLANEILLGIRAQKLDEELGFLHSIHYGRNSLALDLMEEFRAPFVDAWIIRLFNKKIFNDDHYHGSESGYILNKEGYHKFCMEYHRHVVDPVDWRKIFLEQAAIMKKALLERCQYEPYKFD